jgi:tight adherence protein C
LITGPETLLRPLAALSACLAVAGAAAVRRPGPLGAMTAPAGDTVDAERWRPRRQTRRSRRRRLRHMDAEVPQMLDLMAAAARAGASAETALRQAAAVLGGPLGTDLRGIFEAADLGARWRDLLAEAAEASGSKDLRRTVAVIERTERLGSPLSEASRDLAASVRQSRRTATLERARTAPVKMLFPLVFLILPAFLLLTVVPVLLATVRAIA